MKYGFKELIDVPKLQKLTDELYNASSITSAIIDIDGDILTNSGWQRICTDFHRRHPQIEKKCIESDTRLRCELENGDPFVIYKCPRGLINASAPILIEGQHVANVFLGQVLFSPPDDATIQFFREQARQFGFDETDYLQALKEVPIFSEKRFRSAAAFLTSLAQIIADMGLRQLRDLEVQDELRESRERFRLIAESSGEGIWQIDLFGKVTYASPACERIFGYTPEESIGLDSRELFPPSEAKKVAEAFSKVLGAERYHLYEFTAIKKDGTSFPLEISASPVTKGGAVVGVQGTFRDITERKRAEREHGRLRNELTNAIEMAHLGPWEYDVASDTFTFNDHFYKMFRTTAADVGGYQMRSAEYARRFLHPDDMYMVAEAIRETLETHDPDLNQNIEHRIRYADGTEGYITVRAGIVKDAYGKTIKTFGVNQDITERKQAEQKLRESEEKLLRAKKMESMGLLAGGVAHDLNNILSGIVTYPELLLLNMPQESPLRKPIETIQACGHKASAIVQDLLTIARGVAIEKHPMSLNDVISSYLTSPEHSKIIQYHPTVTVTVDLADQLLNVKGSMPHISKAVMNLVANACEAIEGMGTVTLTTENRYVDLPLRGYDDVNEGEYAVLTVKDSGPGIPPEELDRIFEPFYSKKVMGRSGTGLGLAVVWNVVQDHQGYINVWGDGNGTIFELYFPITREDLWEKDVPLSIDDYKGHGESILVVDDEESQREIFRSMLGILGYSVETADGGEAADDYMRAHPVDLVILDMIMAPGMNGLETYARIKEMRPNQKAIIVSGFAETEDVKKAQQLGAGRYIKKPVQIEKVGLAIQQALSSGSNYKKPCR